MSESLVHCDNLVKIYKVADLEVIALQGLDLEVAAGEMIAIVGTSGSGKSTLLNILGGLDTPSAGTCNVGEYELTRLTDAQRLEFRQLMIGHIWQQSGRNLIPEFTIATNVNFPQMASFTDLRGRKRHSQELLERVGLGKMGHKYPYQLSGGEQQRAGIAVALANSPRLLLADEPTGELDSTTAMQVLGLLHDLNRDLGLTIILVTHDPAIAAEADRVIAIRDGRTSTETVRRTAPAANGQAAQTRSAVIGLSSETHREALVIDRAGRLQLPRAMVHSVDFDGRAEVRDAGDHLELWPLHDPHKGDGIGEAEPSPRHHSANASMAPESQS